MESIVLFCSLIAHVLVYLVCSFFSWWSMLNVNCSPLWCFSCSVCSSLQLLSTVVFHLFYLSFMVLGTVHSTVMYAVHSNFRCLVHSIVLCAVHSNVLRTVNTTVLVQLIYFNCSSLWCFHCSVQTALHGSMCSSFHCFMYSLVHWLLAVYFNCSSPWCFNSSWCVISKSSLALFASVSSTSRVALLEVYQVQYFYLTMLRYN